MSLGVIATSGMGYDSYAAANGHLTGNLRTGLPLGLADPLLRRTPLAGGAGALSLSVTAPGQGDGWGKPVETLSLRIGANASAELSGLAQTMNAMTPLLKDAMAFEKQARELADKVQSELAFFRSGPEVKALRSAIASRNAAAILGAAGPVLDRLEQTEKMLGMTERLLNNADALLARATALPMDYSASAAVRGALEMDRTLRLHVAEARGDKASARLSVGVTLGTIVPMGSPQPTPLAPGLAPLRTLMVSVSAIAHTTFEGVSELRGLLGDAASLAKDARSFVRDTQANPLALLADGEAEKAAKRIEDVQKKGEALVGRVDGVLGGLGVKVEAGLRVREATGVGAGVREVSAQVDGKLGSNFDYRVGVRLRNLIGFIPGQVTDYRLEQDPKTRDLRFGIVSSQKQNVFSDFYAFGAASDLSIRAHSGSASLELRGGVDASAAGVSAYGGLIAGLHGFYLAAGAVVPDVRHPSVLPPQLSLGLGFQNKDVALSLSTGADVGVFRGAEATRGANAALSFSAFF
jgi:hypothetical protein